MLQSPNSNTPALRLRDGIPDVAPPVEAPYELEPDPGGLFRCWGVLLATPGLYYHGAWVPVDLDTLEALRDHQARLLGLGYEIPILALHDEEALEGRRAGHVGVFELADGTDGETYLLAGLTFSDPLAEARKARGEYRYLSAGIGPYEDDLGYSAPWGVYEVSLVPRPWQKRLGPTHLLSEDTMAPKPKPTPAPIQTGEPMPEEATPVMADPPAAPAAPPEPMPEEAAPVDEQAAMISAIVAELAGLKGRVEALEAGGASVVAEAPPAPPEPSMLGDVARGLGLSETQTQGVEAAAKTDPKAALALLLGMVRPSAAPPKPSTALSANPRPDVPAPAPQAPQGKRDTWAACMTEAKGDAQKALALYEQRTK